MIKALLLSNLAAMPLLYAAVQCGAYMGKQLAAAVGAL